VNLASSGTRTVLTSSWSPGKTANRTTSGNIVSPSWNVPVCDVPSAGGNAGSCLATPLCTSEASVVLAAAGGGGGDVGQPSGVDAGSFGQASFESTTPSLSVSLEGGGATGQPSAVCAASRGQLSLTSGTPSPSLSLGGGGFCEARREPPAISPTTSSRSPSATGYLSPRRSTFRCHHAPALRIDPEHSATPARYGVFNRAGRQPWQQSRSIGECSRPGGTVAIRGATDSWPWAGRALIRERLSRTDTRPLEAVSAKSGAPGLKRGSGHIASSGRVPTVPFVPAGRSPRRSLYPLAPTARIGMREIVAATVGQPGQYAPPGNGLCDRICLPELRLCGDPGEALLG
jgi:hypothetical protein